MQQNGSKIAQHQVSPASISVAAIKAQLRAAIENAHEHRKAHMPRNRKNGTGKGDGQSIIEDVFHVFKGGKAQRNENSIENRVISEIEIRVALGAPVKKKEFRAFLYRSHAQERQQYGILRIRWSNPCIQKRFGQNFQHNGCQRGGNAS